MREDIANKSRNIIDILLITMKWSVGGDSYVLMHIVPLKKMEVSALWIMFGLSFYVFLVL